MANTKPAYEIRLGDLRFTAWRSDSNGVSRYNVTVSESEKKGEDEWVTTDYTEALCGALLAFAAKAPKK